jgi:hypothetical protein
VVIAGEDGGQGAQHLIGDVQRFGLLSAAAVVDRYTEIINRATRDASFRLEPLPTDERGTGWMVDSAARLAEAYLSLVDTTARLIGTRAKPDAAVPEMEKLVLPQTGPGFSSEISLWVHNPTPSSATAIDLHVTTLISSGGVNISPASVTFSPERLDVVDAGTAREVRLRIDVPAGQFAGQYHGLVLISAAPFEPIALRLDVNGRERARHDGNQ